MPKYTQPRKTWQYTTDFKIKAVKLSLQNGLQMESATRGVEQGNKPLLSVTEMNAERLRAMTQIVPNAVAAA